MASPDLTRAEAIVHAARERCASRIENEFQSRNRGNGRGLAPDRRRSSRRHSVVRPVQPAQRRLLRHRHRLLHGTATIGPGTA